MVARIYIGRLSRDARERDVENFFKGYGRIIDVALKDGYGFVNFEDDRDADDAVFNLNGKELCGGRVIIERARSPSSRRDVRGGNNFVGRGRGFPSRRSFGRDRGRGGFGTGSFQFRGGFGTGSFQFRDGFETGSFQFRGGFGRGDAPAQQQPEQE